MDDVNMDHFALNLRGGHIVATSNELMEISHKKYGDEN